MGEPTECVGHDWMDMMCRSCEVEDAVQIFRLNSKEVELSIRCLVT